MNAPPAATIAIAVLVIYKTGGYTSGYLEKINLNKMSKELQTIAAMMGEIAKEHPVEFPYLPMSPDQLHLEIAESLVEARDFFKKQGLAAREREMLLLAFLGHAIQKELLPDWNALTTSRLGLSDAFTRLMTSIHP